MENIKKEIVRYLTKTSQHTFVKPNGSIFKVIENGETFRIFENQKIRDFDIDYYIQYYGQNSKSVIRHRLFLKKDMKSIRNIRNISDLETL